MSETITADHLNATHLGKKISILDIHPLSGPCMEPCCYSTPELAIKAGTRIYRNMLKDNK